MERLKLEPINPDSESTYLLFDDLARDYFYARRLKSEIREEFHDLEIGESRMITPTSGITRES